MLNKPVQLIVLLGLFLLIVIFAAYKGMSAVGEATRVSNAQLSCRPAAQSCDPIGCCPGLICKSGTCQKPCTPSAVCSGPTTSQVTYKSCQSEVFRCKSGCNYATGKCR